MKQLSMLVLAVMASVAVRAQSASFGLKGGLNLATLSVSQDSRDFQNRAGFFGGLFAHVPLGTQLAIQPEVVYSSQGTKYTDDDNFEHNLRLNYVNIPVMLQAMVGRGFFAEVGPQIGFLVGAADKIGDVETGAVTTKDFKKNDVALGFGLGYSGMSGLGIGARYNLGLTDINNSGLSNNLKNNVLQIGLTYQLGR
jgi:opacity protein-like surface antigen